MSNFGWDDIYRPFAGDFLAYADRARTAYAKGQLLLRCPFDLAMDWGVAECSIRIGLQSTPTPARLVAAGPHSARRAVGPGRFRRDGAAPGSRAFRWLA